MVGIPIAGAVMIALGLFFLWRTWSFLQRAVDTEGVVVGMKESRSSKGSGYSPIFEYRSADGAMHRVTEGSSSSHPGVAVGDTVPVKYDPKRPDKGRLAKPLNLWGFGGFFVFLGTLFVVVGLTRVS
jgi:hypothetical protein